MKHQTPASSPTTANMAARNQCSIIDEIIRQVPASVNAADPVQRG